MAEAYSVQVDGLRELIRVGDECDKKTKKFIRDEFRKTAEPVRDAAIRKFSRYNRAVASRYRIVVRRTGVISVEQPARRTTGLREDFGKLQYSRALIPGLQENTDEVVERVNHAIGEIASYWGRGG